MLPTKTVTGNVLPCIFCSIKGRRNYWGPWSTYKKPNNVRPVVFFFFLRDDLDSIVAAKLVLKHYKHCDPTQPVELLIYRDQPICPVSQMLDYFSVRGNAPGPLFCSADGSPIPRSYFTRSLKEVLQYCNLDEDRYKTHSFRIGAASWAAAKGMSDSQIRAFGRWNSNAFLKYIRMPTLGKES